MRYRIPPRVAYVVPEDVGDGERAPRVSLLRLPDGVPLVLVDSAALIWRVAAEGSADVVADVASEAVQDAESIRADVERFVDDLVMRGLLERDLGPDEGRRLGAV